MSQPRKSDEKYLGYLADQNRKRRDREKTIVARLQGAFEPTAREEELLFRTVHPDEFEQYMQLVAKNDEGIKNRLETLEVRFNELCNMLSVQLANSSFKLLEIRTE